MKKVVLLILLTGSFTAAFADIHRIRVSNYQFSPKRINVVVGDVIRWIWVNGSHTTTSTSVPDGANSWSRSINRNNQRFSYTIRRAGTYRYHCIPHAALGMTGVIVASRALSVDFTDLSIDLS